MKKLALSKKQATCSDQRRFARYGVKLACHVRPWASRKSTLLPQLEVETQNVSSGGLFFVASAEWTVGTAIQFELDRPAHAVLTPVKIRCRGIITRVVPQEEGRIGIGATIDHYRISLSMQRDTIATGITAESLALVALP